MIKKICSYMLSAMFCFGGNIVFSAGKNVSTDDIYKNNISSTRIINQNKDLKTINSRNKKDEQSISNKKYIKKGNKTLSRKYNKSKKSKFSIKANKIYHNRRKIQLVISGGLTSPMVYCCYKKISKTRFLNRIDKFKKFLDCENSFLEKDVSGSFEMYLLNCCTRAKALLGCISSKDFDNDFEMKIFTVFARVGFFTFVDALFDLNIYDGSYFKNIKNLSEVLGDEIDNRTIIKDKNKNETRLVLSKNNVECEIKEAEHYNRKMEVEFKKLLYSDIEERVKNILAYENDNITLIENLQFKMEVLFKSDLDLSNWYKNNIGS